MVPAHLLGWLFPNLTCNYSFFLKRLSAFGALIQSKRKSGYHWSLAIVVVDMDGFAMGSDEELQVLVGALDNYGSES